LVEWVAVDAIAPVESEPFFLPDASDAEPLFEEFLRVAVVHVVKPSISQALLLTAGNQDLNLL
jgi:hypothetical protein